ncbi:hypothetical protein [Photobacterium leiognathi]|uniref:hypothetical protein n=1 Tax=Photobacterium leiognathi TaxID=553611 RepID=UPI002980CE1F|nr:hypothetical protein [Photobacterium leiognathi]
MGRISVLRIRLFNHGEESFLSDLDDAGISHSRVHQFSTAPQASGIVEMISSLSNAMPWNSIAKVLIKWLEVRKSRKVIVTTEDGKVIHLEGYSANQVQKIITNAREVMVFDTKPDSGHDK